MARASGSSRGVPAAAESVAIRASATPRRASAAAASITGDESVPKRSSTLARKAANATCERATVTARSVSLSACSDTAWPTT